MKKQYSGGWVLAAVAAVIGIAPSVTWATGRNIRTDIDGGACGDDVCGVLGSPGSVPTDSFVPTVAGSLSLENFNLTIAPPSGLLGSYWTSFANIGPGAIENPDIFGWCVALCVFQKESVPDANGSLNSSTLGSIDQLAQLDIFSSLDKSGDAEINLFYQCGHAFSFAVNGTAAGITDNCAPDSTGLVNMAFYYKADETGGTIADGFKVISDGSSAPTSVPEPSVFALFALALGVLGAALGYQRLLGRASPEAA
jgi:PEP-CTERM motif